MSDPNTQPESETAQEYTSDTGVNTDYVTGGSTREEQDSSVETEGSGGGGGLALISEHFSESESADDSVDDAEDDDFYDAGESYADGADDFSEGGGDSGF